MLEPGTRDVEAGRRLHILPKPEAGSHIRHHDFSTLSEDGLRNGSQVPDFNH